MPVGVLNHIEGVASKTSIPSWRPSLVFKMTSIQVKHQMQVPFCVHIACIYSKCYQIGCLKVYLTHCSNKINMGNASLMISYDQVLEISTQLDEAVVECYLNEKVVFGTLYNHSCGRQQRPHFSTIEVIFQIFYFSTFDDRICWR